MPGSATRQVPVHDPDWWTGDSVWDDLAWLREHDPLHRVRTSGGDVLAVSRHAEVMEISRHPERFVSGKGILIDDMRRHVTGDESIIYLDPPEHARHRKLVSGWFKPSTVRSFEARVRDLAVELLDRLPRDETVDANEELAVPLPILVISEMLGVPAEDQADFRRWSDDVIMEGSSQQSTGQMPGGLLEIFTYFQGQLARRRDDPRHDVLSTLLAAELDGEALSEYEMLAFCMTLLVAGNETTRNLIANGLETFAQHPDQWDRLRDDPSLVPTAVEELLRWVTPIQHFTRTAVGDDELAGEPVDAGETLVMLYTSANRDRDVFGHTADDFDVGRDPNPHVALGFGEHFCLGAQLARLETRVLLEEMLPRVRSIELAGPVVRRRSNLMRGLAALPVRLRA